MFATRGIVRPATCANVRCKRPEEGKIFLVMVGMRHVPDEPPFVQVLLCERCAEGWSMFNKAPLVDLEVTG